MKQRIAALLVTVLLLGSCVVTALAGGDGTAALEPIESIGPAAAEAPASVQAEPCPLCDEGTVRLPQLRKVNDLSYKRTVDCAHTNGHGYKHDIFRGTIDAHYGCDTCHYVDVVQEYDYYYETYCYKYEQWFDGCLD